MLMVLIWKVISSGITLIFVRTFSECFSANSKFLWPFLITMKSSCGVLGLPWKTFLNRLTLKLIWLKLFSFGGCVYFYPPRLKISAVQAAKYTKWNSAVLSFFWQLRGFLIIPLKLKKEKEAGGQHQAGIWSLISGIFFSFQLKLLKSTSTVWKSADYDWKWSSWAAEVIPVIPQKCTLCLFSLPDNLSYF